MMHGQQGAFSADEIKGKFYDRRLYGKMAHYLKPYMKWVIISFLVLMLVTGAELILPLIQSTAIDNYIVSDKSIAIFTDENMYQEFMQHYEVLKLKEYSQDKIHFVVISASDRNKMDKPHLEELENLGIVSPQTVFLVDDNATNRAILQQHLEFDANPEDGIEELAGYFMIGSGKIAVSRSKMQELPRNDRLKVRQDSSVALLWLSLLYLGIIIIRFVSGYSQAVMTTTFSQKAMNDLRHDVFAHLQKMPTQYFDKNPVGRLVTRVTNDIRAIDEMLASGVITIVQDVILIIAIVALMLILDWQLALVSMAILPLVIWVIAIFRRKTRVIYREVRKYLAQLNATLAEHIAGQKIIQLFNQYSHKRDEFAAINQMYFLTSMKQLKLFAFFRPIIHVSSQIAVAIIIWYGGGQILRSAITIGLLMAFTQYIRKLFEPINDFSEKFNVLQGALAGAERIFDLMALEPEDYRAELINNVKFEGEIEFENVWLAYNHDEWVLKDISFKIKPGEKIALVGHTGSGKTSIVNLILGMYPYQKGRILIDGKNLSSYALRDLRTNVGIVQQDVFIFSGNISENIALNNSKMTAEEIRQVAQYVNADKFIQQLPHKYDEPVMERGATLSTGQRQLIAFARVLAYNPSIFILDEATSNIDTETEILIQDALEKIIKNRTSIIIAHRLSTIQHADRIIVLHKGRIVEEGSHFDLLDKKGLYYDLYRLQYT
ncbi:MAG: ABC transporter ATP-binding protein [Candidatus Cloacimonetes bacterium]|jgi:ATP-binding cassette subfamily B protein/subfamily B ATP-binding cassette protein MsbA|nr:ABC transporter ATP-binding protein/permease [Candidatus Cloacimonadota bacterium]MDY0298789.1 ABC transporter ATP-binding protein [Candidatus Cloacimonadaceae bacterium]MCB5279212.1 ABC transporter ATP-binding protein/permease [Candidatus Cloacimonadota bacterium]MCK9333009.1 ABC transporter ATP-binding protein/permease [Candidatus Cloacimonadota bacterium]MDD2210025.1 ABC transporter ATP-binding protein [Candidatus Cloacimonadota bacterium]